MSENLPINNEPGAADAEDVEGHAIRSGRAYKSGRDDQAAPSVAEPGDDDDDVEGHSTRGKF